MKRKYLLPIIATCMAVAVLAVGFAGWLITGHTATDTAEGNFVTYDVSNKYFTVTIDPTDGNAEEIVFGHPGGTESPDAWLKYQNVNQEDLEAEFTVTIRPDVAFNTAPEVGRDVAAVLDGDNVVVTLNLPTEYTNAQTAGYVGAVTMAATNGTYAGNALTLPANAFTITADGEDANKTATCKIKVTFSWGTNGNPYTYYNGLGEEGNTPENRKAAGDLLEAVYALNSDTVKYTLSLSVEAGTGAGA